MKRIKKCFDVNCHKYLNLHASIACINRKSLYLFRFLIFFACQLQTSQANYLRLKMRYDLPCDVIIFYSELIHFKEYKESPDCSKFPIHRFKDEYLGGVLVSLLQPYTGLWGDNFRFYILRDFY